MDDHVEEIENIIPIISKRKTEAELMRERNIKEREAFFASLLKDPEFAEAVEAINAGYQQKHSKTINDSFTHVKKRTRKTKDELFRFSGLIPAIPRKSSRIRNIAPTYSESDLVDEPYYKRRSYNGHNSDSDFEDIEDIVYVPKPKRQSINRARTKHVIVPVEEVSEEMLSAVVMRVSDKKYSDKGTSCHQCRQKTSDQKTCCRSESCYGVRGQFCGVCLHNRYGEDAVKALKDPNWHCPVCRGICNCSFCRAREGKRPTGILAPLAQKEGHKSVKDFLDSLKGEGDYADESRDPKKLLGFSQDLRFAQMGGGVKYQFENLCDLKQLTKCCENLERKLMCCKSENSLLLRGFEKNYAKFDHGDDIHLECVFSENCNFIENK